MLVVLALAAIAISCAAPALPAAPTSYGWSDLGTLHWDRATSRTLAAEKYLGILGTSNTMVQVSIVEHVQQSGEVLTHDHGVRFQRRGDSCFESD
jgi:hypothetical protein